MYFAVGYGNYFSNSYCLSLMTYTVQSELACSLTWNKRDNLYVYNMYITCLLCDMWWCLCCVLLNGSLVLTREAAHPAVTLMGTC